MAFNISGTHCPALLGHSVLVIRGKFESAGEKAYLPRDVTPIGVLTRASITASEVTPLALTTAPLTLDTGKGQWYITKSNDVNNPDPDTEVIITILCAGVGTPIPPEYAVVEELEDEDPEGEESS